MTVEENIHELKTEIQNLEQKNLEMHKELVDRSMIISNLQGIIDKQDKDINTLQTRLKVLQADNEKKNKEANTAISRLGTVTSENADKTREINALLEIALSLSRSVEAMSV